MLRRKKSKTDAYTKNDESRVTTALTRLQLRQLWHETRQARDQWTTGVKNREKSTTGTDKKNASTPLTRLEQTLSWHQTRKYDIQTMHLKRQKPWLRRWKIKTYELLLIIAVAIVTPKRDRDKTLTWKIRKYIYKKTDKHSGKWQKGIRLSSINRKQIFPQFLTDADAKLAWLETGT